MLQKHPDQLTDSELEAWVRRLVDEKVSEGPRLDYKATIDLQGNKGKLEAAKDISSFANEIGGTLIYGIPEDRQSDEVALPKEPYGIDPIPGLKEQLENIYVDSIIPRLPETRIKKIELSKYPGKVVYVAWAPESWLGPHMVSAYGEKRYYHRGQLRAVPMEEHEVRLRYERSQRLKSGMIEFLDSQKAQYMNWYSRLPDTPVLTSSYVLCPQFPVWDSFELWKGHVHQWLDANPYDEQSHRCKWTPCAEGVEACDDASPRERLRFGESRIYRNGAITRWRETSTFKDKQESFSVEHTKEHKLAIHLVSELKRAWDFLKFGSSLYEGISYYGPVWLRICLFSSTVLPLYLPLPWDWPETWPSLRRVGDAPIVLDLQISAARLVKEPKWVIKALGDQLFTYFGRWEAPTLDDQFWAPICGKG